MSLIVHYLCTNVRQGHGDRNPSERTHKSEARAIHQIRSAIHLHECLPGVIVTENLECGLTKAPAALLVHFHEARRPLLELQTKEIARGRSLAGRLEFDRRWHACIPTTPEDAGSQPTTLPRPEATCEVHTYSNLDAVHDLSLVEVEVELLVQNVLRLFPALDVAIAIYVPMIPHQIDECFRYELVLSAGPLMMPCHFYVEAN